MALAKQKGRPTTTNDNTAATFGVRRRHCFAFRRIPPVLPHRKSNEIVPIPCTEKRSRKTNKDGALKQKKRDRVLVVRSSTPRTPRPISV